MTHATLAPSSHLSVCDYDHASSDEDQSISLSTHEESLLILTVADVKTKNILHTMQLIFRCSRLLVQTALSEIIMENAAITDNVQKLSDILEDRLSLLLENDVF